MKYVFICALALLITGALAGGAARYRRSHVPITQDTSVTDKQLPIIISAIKSLEIVHAFVDTHGQLNVVLRNKSEKGIQAFTVSAGTYSETLDEGLVMDHPKVIIEPKA